MPEPPEPEPTHDAYLAYRQYLLEMHRESARSFDRIVFALAGGALAISITFVDALIDDAQWQWLLFASWCSFALSLLAELLSTYFAERDYFHSIAAVDQAFDDDRFPAEIGRSSRFEALVPGLNLAALALFVAGLGALIAFAGLNLGGMD